MNAERIRQNWESVRDRMGAAARRAGRGPDEVRLIAVTKKSPAEWVSLLVDCGARDLGENYPQELWAKAETLAGLPIPVRWHLIGHLQTNKLKKTLPMVRLIHSVDSLKLLRALSDAAAELAEPPGVCLQINTSHEPSKYGWEPELVLNDAESIAACTGLPIVGLMTIAALGTTPEQARPCFTRLREVRDQLSQRTGLPLRELSMGMSNDFETAIEEGATYVRVGSALFEGLTR